MASCFTYLILDLVRFAPSDMIWAGNRLPPVEAGYEFQEPTI